MSGQLDIFHQPEPAEDPELEPDEPRNSQLTELPGTTFEEIFGPPQEAA